METLACPFQNYRLGNPLEPETTLGPMVKAKAADFVRDQIAEAGTVSTNTVIPLLSMKAMDVFKWFSSCIAPTQ
jgi:acyl-CoA reductase-like NAD-dependent aldehyde dehydrogenase